MARVECDAVIRETDGQAGAGQLAYIYERGTSTKVTLYSGETGSGTIANPVAADAEGRIEAWVEEGSYDIVVNGVVHPWEAVKGLGLPVGTLLAFAGATPPTGFLACDGSVVSQATYATLYAVLGAVYNIGGEAAGSFRLPDMRGRVPVGEDGAGGRMTANEVRGASGGQERVLLVATESGIRAHGHGFTQPSVTVSANQVATTAGGGSLNRLTAFSSSGNNSGNFTASGGSVSNATAADAIDSHLNMQPYQVVNYIIRY